MLRVWNAKLFACVTSTEVIFMPEHFISSEELLRKVDVEMQRRICLLHQELHLCFYMFLHISVCFNKHYFIWRSGPGESQDEKPPLDPTSVGGEPLLTRELVRLWKATLFTCGASTCIFLGGWHFINLEEVLRDLKEKQKRDCLPCQEHVFSFWPIGGQTSWSPNLFDLPLSAQEKITLNRLLLLGEQDNSYSMLFYATFASFCSFFFPCNFLPPLTRECERLCWEYGMPSCLPAWQAQRLFSWLSIL